MAEPDEGRDPEGTHRSAQPGGGTSRGPNPDPGGDEQPGGLVPPYEGRTGAGDASDERAESVERQLADVDPGAKGQTASPADEQPVSSDDVTGGEPDADKGVGESSTERAEDVEHDDGKEAGRHDTGTSGAGRPTGTSDARDSTGVDPQEAQGDAPTLPSGDQGG